MILEWHRSLPLSQHLHSFASATPRTVGRRARSTWHWRSSAAAEMRQWSATTSDLVDVQHTRLSSTHNSPDCGLGGPSSMDYSSLQSDSENPAASSPWATSPQRSKSGFEHNAPTASDDVSLPSPAIAAQQTSRARPHDQALSLAQQEDRPASDAFGAENGHRDNLAYRSQERYQQQSPPNTSNGQRSAQHRDTAGKMPARPAPPQYKLQAKINGLERSGRKDPILRFDVYVLRLIRARLPPDAG